MEQIKLYLKESYNELINKVSWPTWNVLLSTTTVVLAATAITAVVVTVMDLISRQITSLFYSF